MNNKGFAISGILYSILLLSLVLVTLMLFNLQNKKTLLDKLKSDAINAVEADTNYEYLLNEINGLRDEILDKTYPVGSIYISTTDNTKEKVEARFGGEWIVFGNGRTLVSTTEESEQTGGQSSTSYTPAGTIGDTTLTIYQMPRHSHIAVSMGSGCTTQHHSSAIPHSTGYDPKDGACAEGTTIAGDSQPHTHSFTGTSTNIPTVSPYITVYMYKRVG